VTGPAAFGGGAFAIKRVALGHDCIWHIADNPTAAANVRFWTKADKGGLLAATVCPLMTDTVEKRFLEVD
jgi:hypothetical protein